LRENEKDYQEAISAIKAKRDADNEALRELYAPQFDEIAQELGGAKLSAATEIRLKTIKDHIKTSEARANLGEEQSETLTKHLERLKKLRTTLVEKSPIPGLTSGPQGLTLDGVSFVSLNLAKQIEIALKIAQLSPGAFGMILVDNLEHLDSRNYNAMISAMEGAATSSGLQFIGARVTEEEDLRIEKSGGDLPPRVDNQ
jgi:hypothetical protein